MDHAYLAAWMMIAIIFMIVVGTAIYFLPSVIAYSRSARNFLAIFMLNLFLGWSLVGWLGSLIWALVDEKKDQAAPAPACPAPLSPPPPAVSKPIPIAYCPQCGQSVGSADQFCSHCGHPLQQ
ncbi:MAG: superinfection immunity protein [Candidatus Igneacidithiobacillus chanchocoensis]